MDQVEHTLYICREVSVFKIPPRPASTGHKSGEWKVADKLFSGRLRLIAVSSETCELRLEDARSGELFGVCPVAKGQRAVVVEPVSDSSRYFVLRLQDKSSGRHAFVGLGFTDRAEAFDFNVALSDHEKQAQRAAPAEPSAGGSPGPSWASKEIAALDTGRDFSLKEGEVIKVNVKKPASSGVGSGFLSQMNGGGLAKPPAAGGLAAPPPASTPAPRISPRGGLAGPAPSSQHPAFTQYPQQQAFQGHATADPFLPLGGASSHNPPAHAQPQKPAAALAPVVNQVPDSWASFD
ncbi:hypothetical protein WJX73_006805 [Symbiochloris irregularis]|uniref:NECAP PHear domain-containing protein n=1 Tax=Symbiochloris irregularis TaxID=706552 RepID=A0AAW1P3E8_9CHLO